MIGTRFSNSDVRIYLENRDIEMLGLGEIVGNFVNMSGVLGILKLSVKGKERIEIKIDKTPDEEDITEMRASIRSLEYETLKEKRRWGIHEGYRHVDIDDVNAPNFDDKMSYDSLRIKRGDEI